MGVGAVDMLAKLDYTKLFVRKSLIKMCFTDYDREMTLTAEVESEDDDLPF